MEIAGNRCKCNATGSIRHDYGMQIDDIDWMEMANGSVNQFTCRARRKIPHLISCFQDGVTPGASSIEVILSCCCLLLLGVSLFLFYKLWKKKNEDEIDLVQMDDSKSVTATNDAHN